MKLQQIILASLLAGGAVLTTGCRDDWSEMNQDPSNITTSSPDYLFTQAVLKFEPSDYTYWFYNAPEFYYFAQMGVPTGSVSETYNQASGGTGLKSTVLRTYANEIDATLAKMDEGERASYTWTSAAADVLSIYLGIYDTDFIGDIPYTEAGSVRVGGPLTPKMDKVKDLYDLWLTNLEKDMQTFASAKTASTATQQDLVYQGSMSKWAKLANSLRLKIAARLYNEDPTRAKEIAVAVATAEVGYLDSDSDDPTQGESMIFNKGSENTSSSDYVYHWGNDVLTSTAPSQTLMNFMLDNRDPRVRFVFTKNSWNSKIVQGFLDAGKYDQIPSFVLENCNISEDHKTFLSWKSEKDGEAWGEPWVRYVGLPQEYQASKEAKYNEYFNYSAEGYSKLDADHAYRPYSRFNQEMIRGRVTTQIPTLPGDNIIQDQDEHPWYGMYMTAAETNLYLAEFAELGANLPKTAQEYFSRGLELSVKEYNEVAALNKIPYYGTTYNYDPNEKVIDLQNGEIDAMLAHSDYQLNGTQSENLEKIYLQQMIHFFLNPIDQWTTARRSGCPTFSSGIFKRVDYAGAANGNMPASAFPRRVAISEISPSNKMYQIYTDSYKEQGYTIGTSDMTKLNSERIWQDKNAPQYGAGPQVK